MECSHDQLGSLPRKNWKMREDDRWRILEESFNSLKPSSPYLCLYQYQYSDKSVKDLKITRYFPAAQKPFPGSAFVERTSGLQNRSATTNQTDRVDREIAFNTGKFRITRERRTSFKGYISSSYRVYQCDECGLWLKIP